MTLTDFASLSTAVSGVAVTASLIYLALQTHQNTKHTRALIQQGATARVTAITLDLMDAEKSAAWIEGNGGLPTPQEVRKHQFALHCITALNAMEDLFAQNCDGLLTVERYRRECSTFRGLLSQPGMRAFWQERRLEFIREAPKFAAFVESLAIEPVSGFTHYV